MKNNSAFTLLEILVVIIIVGVLASVAMPALFRNVKRAEGVEALHTLGMIKRGIEGCAMQFAGNVIQCAPNTAATFDNIGMKDPSNTVNPQSKFNYTVFCGGIPGNFNCGLVATDATDNTNTITLTFTQNSTSRSGSSAFAGIQ